VRKAARRSPWMICRAQRTRRCLRSISASSPAAIRRRACRAVGPPISANRESKTTSSSGTPFFSRFHSDSILRLLLSVLITLYYFLSWRHNHTTLHLDEGSRVTDAPQERTVDFWKNENARTCALHCAACHVYARIFKTFKIYRRRIFAKLLYILIIFKYMSFFKIYYWISLCFSRLSGIIFFLLLNFPFIIVILIELYS